MRSGNVEHFGVTIKHRHDVIAVAHIGNAEYPWLLGNVEPDLDVQRVRIGRGAAVIIDRGIGPHLDDLAHRCMFGILRSDIGLLLADHLEGNQRVPVDVRFVGDAYRFHHIE
jgi:hypothetical protein